MKYHSYSGEYKRYLLVHKNLSSFSLCRVSDQVALELPFEQFVEYFETKDLGRIRELWEEATIEWSEMICAREMGDSDN